MDFQAEQLLHSNVQRRRSWPLVVDRVGVAGRRHEVGRRLGVELLRARSHGSSVSRASARSSAPISDKRGLAGEEWRQAIRRRSRPAPRPTDRARRRGHRPAGTRPGRATAAAPSSTAGGRCPGRRCPAPARRRRKARRYRAAAGSPASDCRVGRMRRARRRPRPPSNAISSRDRDALGRNRQDFRLADRGCQQDTRRRSRSGHFGDHQERRSSPAHRLASSIAPRPLASRYCAAGPARFRDPLGIGQRQQRGRRWRISPTRARNRPLVAGHCRPALREPPHRLAPARRDRGGTRRGDGADRYRCRQDRARRSGRRSRPPRRPRRRSAAAITIEANRGGSGSARRRLPCVGNAGRRRPRARASDSNSSRAATSAARGGGSSQRSRSGSASPQAAQSSSRPARSAFRISGSAKAGNACVCGSSHRR